MKNGDRIVSGQDADRNEYPWMTFLFMRYGELKHMYLRSGVYSLILHRQLWNILRRLCHQLSLGPHSSSLCRGARDKLGAISTSKCFIDLGSSSNINRELLPNNVRRKITTLDKHNWLYPISELLEPH